MPRPRSEEELEELANQHQPVSRTSLRRTLTGPVSKSREVFVKDVLEYEHEGNLHSITWIASGSCDRGHVLSEGTELVGPCERCGALLCSHPDCSRTCARGHLVCGRCSVSTAQGIYCHAHLPAYLARKAGQLALRILGAVWRQGGHGS